MFKTVHATCTVYVSYHVHMTCTRGSAGGCMAAAQDCVSKFKTLKQTFFFSNTLGHFPSSESLFSVVLYRPPYQVLLPFSEIAVQLPNIRCTVRKKQKTFKLSLCILCLFLWAWQCCWPLQYVDLEPNTGRAPAHHSLLHGRLAGVVGVEGHDLHVDEAW